MQMLHITHETLCSPRTTRLLYLFWFLSSFFLISFYFFIFLFLVFYFLKKLKNIYEILINVYEFENGLEFKNAREIKKTMFIYLLNVHEFSIMFVDVKIYTYLTKIFVD